MEYGNALSLDLLFLFVYLSLLFRFLVVNKTLELFKEDRK